MEASSAAMRDEKAQLEQKLRLAEAKAYEWRQRRNAALHAASDAVSAMEAQLDELRTLYREAMARIVELEATVPSARSLV